MVARAIVRHKGVGLHYIANSEALLETERVTATSDPKLASNAVSVTKIG